MRLFAVITGPAQRDVLDIAEYLELAAGPDVRERIVLAIAAAVRKLSAAPTLGHPLPEIASSDVRFYLVKSHFVVYRAKNDTLEVLRVLHAARDLRGVFGVEP